MNLSQITDEVGVHKSTMSRVFNRNRGLRGWRPKHDEGLRDIRRLQCLNAQRLSTEDWTEVERLIWLDLSQEQASQRLALEAGVRISHEMIYLQIYADKRKNGNLSQHLRFQKPRRKRYASSQDRRGMIRNRVSIDQRPDIVTQKSRIGDWEGDTMIGKDHQA